DAERVDVIQKQDQVPQVAAEPIQPPAHQDIEPSSLRVLQQLVERRPPLLRPAHTLVDVFTKHCPTAGFTVTPQLDQLILWVLLPERRNPRVDSYHHFRP